MNQAKKDQLRLFYKVSGHASTPVWRVQTTEVEKKREDK